MNSSRRDSSGRSSPHFSSSSDGSSRYQPRIRYDDGQSLQSKDLQADVQYETWMRELHVRGVHQTWGVALGFEVKLNMAQWTVKVGPGLAYDVQGREIVSSRPVVLKVPALPPNLPPAQNPNSRWCVDLLVRHQSLTELMGDRDRTSSCISPASLLEDEPFWRWSFAGEAVPNKPAPLLAEDVRKGEEIPLARFQISPTRVSGPDFFLRRQTQGFIRPYFASGSVQQGAYLIEGTLLHWSVWIPTSGFTGSHTGSNNIFYFVNLMDHPLSPTSGFTAPLKAALGEAAFAELQKTCVGPFVSIEASGSYGFTLRVRMARATLPENLQNQTSLLIPPRGEFLPVPVNWMGLELVEGSPPPPLDLPLSAASLFLIR